MVQLKVPSLETSSLDFAHKPKTNEQILVVKHNNIASFDDNPIVLFLFV